MDKLKKILVQYLNPDTSTKWRKYTMDVNQKVLIKLGKSGPGGFKIEPTVKTSNIFTKGWFRKPYVIYPHGAKGFLERGKDAELPKFSMEAVEKYFEDKAMSWVRNVMKGANPMLLYIIIGLLLLLTIMSAGGFGYINI